MYDIIKTLQMNRMINPFDYDSDYWAGRKENEEKK